MLDGGYIPNPVIRVGIRRLLAQREAMIRSESLAAAYERKMAYIAKLRERPIAIEQDKANTQHYEVGTGVLEACLGPRMKYSSCLYPQGGETLAQAEVAMLQLYVEKAELKDGMKILDLGYAYFLLLSDQCLFSTLFVLFSTIRYWKVIELTTVQLRLGFGISLLCRMLPKFSNHSILQQSHSTNIYRVSRQVEGLD